MHRTAAGRNLRLSPHLKRGPAWGFGQIPRPGMKGVGEETGIQLGDLPLDLTTAQRAAEIAALTPAEHEPPGGDPVRDHGTVHLHEVQPAQRAGQKGPGSAV